jgi:hypothetical protein
MDFDIDCGEVLRGHELRFTGLRRDGTTDDSIHVDYSEHTDGKPVHPMWSLTYTLTPELDDDALPDGRDVDITIELDPPPDPAVWPPVMMAGGERECARGASRTHGAFGPFIVPAETTSITVELMHVGVTVGTVHPLDDRPGQVVGTLVLDLLTERATWHPASESTR